MSDRVGLAVAAVNRDRYVLLADGTQIPQSSRPELIAEMLRLLDVAEGSRILEIGTGSAYSTALLCNLVGERGSVASVDIDEEMVARARALLPEDGMDNAEVLVGDGRRGYAPRAPYDRLVAWASADEGVPAEWLEQVLPGGVMVVPVRGRRVLKLRVLGSGGSVVEEASIESGFIPLTAQPLKPWETLHYAPPA